MSLIRSTAIAVLLLHAFVVSPVALAEAAEQQAAQKPLSAGRTLSKDERRLEQRAIERWEALRVLDMARVYSYATPAYRGAFDSTHHSMQYGAQVERLAAKVISLERDAEDPLTARLKLEFRYRSHTAVPGKVYEDVAWTDQTWIKENGQWWYVEPK